MKTQLMWNALFQGLEWTKNMQRIYMFIISYNAQKIMSLEEMKEEKSFLEELKLTFWAPKTP